MLKSMHFDSHCRSGVGMAQWWERSPPKCVTRVRFPGIASYVGWVCCWFSSLLRGFFFGFSGFSPSTKTYISKLYFDPVRGPTWRLALADTASSLNKAIYLFILKLRDSRIDNFFSVFPLSSHTLPEGRASAERTYRWDQVTMKI